MPVDISGLIPHGDGMVVLDEVISWDSQRICCCSHIARGCNALIDSDSMDPVLFIEYAAQAAAVHAGLINVGLGERRPAYIGAVKNAHWEMSSIQLPIDVEVSAEALMVSDSGAVYEVAVKTGGVDIFIGRLLLNQP